MSNGNLFNADLRGSNRDNALLRNTGLTSAKFHKKDIESAILDNTQFSFYLPKTKETKKYSLNKFMDFADPKIRLLWKDELFDKLIFFRAGSRFREDLLWEILTSVKDIPEAEAKRKSLSTAFATRVAIYFDVCEHLTHEADSKGRKKQKATGK